jgi:serine protease AprX
MNTFGEARTPFGAKPSLRATGAPRSVTGEPLMAPAGRTTRRWRWLATFAAAAAVAAPAFSASAGVPLAKGSTWAARPGTAGTQRKVIVQARVGHESAVAAAIRATGGSVDSYLDIVNGFAAHVPANALAALRARADVRAVTENSEIKFASNVYDESTVASSYVKTAGATAAWSTGNLGEGVGIAVIDTGVSPQNDFSGRLVSGPDLSGEGTLIDSYGHGTVMAGIIGGSGADSANNNNGAYAGVAPKSTVVGVKVAGRNGSTDVSTMLQAMHWVAAYKDQYNIRVVNLSWGTDSQANPATDPINFAVERLWKLGIVVVVSAGNSGSNAGTITKPGDDPLVISVGAYDDRGDLNTANDQIPGWSSRGPTAQGLTKPDLIAPGRTLVSTRSFGSYVEQNNPKALVSPSYIKGSGTSEAAAVVSGLSALLVKAHPDWTPDQVKAALRNTANPMGGVPANTQGKGRVNFAAATVSDPGAATQQTFAGNGLGSIEASRGSSHVYADCQQNGTYTLIQGEINVFCNPWDGTAWTGTAWTGTAWTGTAWTGTAWTGTAWTGTAWTGTAWTGTAWTGGTWSGTAWTGTAWTGTAWTGTAWTGTMWTGTAWTGTAWTGTAWTSAEYTDDTTDFLNAFWGARPKAGKHVNGEKSEPMQSARAQGDD